MFGDPVDTNADLAGQSTSASLIYPLNGNDSGALPLVGNQDSPGSYNPSAVDSLSNSNSPEKTAQARTAASTDPLTGTSAVSNSDGAGNKRQVARDIGILSGSQKFTDAVGSKDTNDYYKFKLNEDDAVNIYVNKEAGGATLQLLDVNGKKIDSSTNKGSGAPGGSITQNLTAGTYYARVAPWSKWSEPNIDYTLTFNTQNTLPPPDSGSPDNDKLTEYDLGTLSNAQEFTDSVGETDLEDSYKFTLSEAETISVFLNGLAAGTTIELSDSTGNVVQSSTNQGTRWSATDSGNTAGSITSFLAAGTYYVNVTPGAINGNSLYDDGDNYTLTFQPHEAPNTVTVAASDTVNKGGADYVANGVDDQAVINQAIAQVGANGGGTVLLLGGTFNIANNVEITYDNITLSGVGWSTVLKQANNTEFEDAGMLRSAFHSDAENLAKASFVGQHFKHLSLDGNKANQTTTHNSYGNFGTYKDSSFEDMRVHDFGYYGFDPHENSIAEEPTIRLTLKNSLADHNGQDGITIDNLVDSTIEGNISDSNTRHGLNICTDSDNNTFSKNITTNNGSNGITIQPGTVLSTTSDANKLIGNTSQFNTGNGIYVYRAENTEIQNNIVTENGKHGIRLRSSSYSSIDGNQLSNNSQEANNQYNEIYLDNDGVMYSTHNTLKANNILDNKEKRSRYGIIERSASDDYNTYDSNTIDGPISPMRILGPNSKIVYSSNQPGRTIWNAEAGDPMAGVTEAPTYQNIDYKNNDSAGNNLQTARKIGSLSGSLEFTDYVGDADAHDYYQFTSNGAQTFSAFLNGLAAGTTLELLDSAGKIVQSSTHKGTTWSSTNSSTTGGLITKALTAGTYYIHLTPGEMNGNPVYANPDKYILTLQPHDAPKTIAVAASNTVNTGGADYVATGVNDQDTINQAIEQVGTSGGGTVLLLDGTFNISESILMTYDNVTLSGVGWSTVLKQANNTEFEDAGMLRSALHSEAENQAFPRFYNQHFKHLSLDGNKANQTTAHNSYGNFGTYGDSSFEDLRVHNFGSYGFDPHENSYAGIPTVRLSIKDSLADHNGKDGITIDNCVYSSIVDNIADSNTRHGFNVVTATRNTNFFNNIASNNGSNGITVQPGSGDLSRTSDWNTFSGNLSQYNKGSGIYVYLGKNNQFLDNTVANNSKHGMDIRSSSYTTVRGNQLRNNSQALHAGYNEIYLNDDGGTYSTNNAIENNNILDDLANRAKYGIAEKSVGDDYNTLSGNIIQGTVKLTRLQGPNSKIV